MSADFSYSYTAAQLREAAKKFTACNLFRVHAEESRVYCAECGGTYLAHIIVALRDTPTESK